MISLPILTHYFTSNQLDQSQFIYLLTESIKMNSKFKVLRLKELLTSSKSATQLFKEKLDLAKVHMQDVTHTVSHCILVPVDLSTAI